MPYMITFRVRGGDWFPTDMLRYDNCRGRCEDDQASIKASPRDWTGKREVELVRAAHNRHACNHVTEARWQSFGWTVLRVDKSFFVPWERVEEYGFDPKTLLPLP